jgi:predicted transposase YbfD/YdcC
MSNQPISKTNKDELFHAIRNHWQVETSNHIRDVTLNEDNLKTSKKRISRIAAGVRTLTISILSKMNVKNIKAQLEKFADNFQNLLTHLRAVNFL